MPMHVMWINEEAEPVGGCESYVISAMEMLGARGVGASLLYGVPDWTDPGFVGRFQRAFPMVDLTRQVAEIDPDLIYIHRLTGAGPVRELIATGRPVVRFFHDHKMFCPREHKYSMFGRRTCTQPIGWRCWTCGGVVGRADNRLGLGLTTVGSLKREQRANRDLTAFVVGSDYMAEHLALHGFDSARINTIPLFSDPPDELPVEDRDPGLLLFAGQLIRGKGLDTALEAMTLANHDCRLVVLGSGRQDEELKTLVRELGLEGRVDFKGRVSREELARYYGRAAAVVFPSRTPETFGLIGPEAMSRATPVIATAVGGTGQWLEDGVTGIAVPPNDPAALARAMDSLLAEPELARRMGAAGLTAYDRCFRPEAHTDRLLELFTRLTGGQR